MRKNKKLKMPIGTKALQLIYYVEEPMVFELVEAAVGLSVDLRQAVHDFTILIGRLNQRTSTVEEVKHL